MSATAETKPAAAQSPASLAHRAADKDIWRSLEELADSGEFRRFIESEFPAIAARLPMQVNRRTLLKLAGASLAMAGLTACSEVESIVPYVRQPENIIPGRPLHYATALSSEGYGIGVIVESHEGRPTKIEGNPDHPSSRGATDAIMQAAVLALFDPDRSRVPLKNGEPAGYGDFLADMAKLSADWAASGGQGGALLVEATTSPTMKAQLEDLRSWYPKLRVYRHDPLAVPAGTAATAKLFGRALAPVYHFDRADVILSLDADFLGEGPGRLAYARNFADRRRVRRPGDTMNRLYTVESTPTLTGTAADRRKAVRPSEVESLAAALQAGRAPAPQWFSAAIEDLVGAGRNSLVVPGERQGPFVHAAAHGFNQRSGAIGTTVDFIAPPDALRVDGDLVALCDAIAGKEVDSVVVLGANPGFTAPADLDVRAAFSRLKLLVHWGLYRDETAQLAHWHVPAAHDLESWSDVSGHDGTVSIVQPLIRPLYGGRTAHEMIAALAGRFDVDALGLVRETWAKRLDDSAWREALRDGLVAGSAVAPVTVETGTGLTDLKPEPVSQGLEVRFAIDPWLRDGRHANCAWLQELPRPLTKQVWGNAALISPATAGRLQLETGQVVNLAHGGRSIDAPVWIMPGHPDETVTLPLGFGRRTGSVAALAGGFDAYRLRTSDAMWFAGGVTLTARADTARLVTTQHHHAMEGRAIVRRASLDHFRERPDFVRDDLPPAPTESLYPDWPYDQEAWGMSIDLSACIGCMACVSACQAENNSPTVGPDECALGHEMHWLRVDRYYAGPPDDPETLFQPVPCMQCEKAPCEIVCPVNATVHTHDGLNAQVYNRCIGTRYCSQNCPYKVRRFNFLEYQPYGEEAGPEQAAHNPDVSVRSRGVMEKCTYCVQRISEARIHAQVDNRAIADGEVVTACQQACPTRAISFGNLNDKRAAVLREKGAPHSYALLEELNTRPRTTYLGRIRNPGNAAVAAEKGRTDG
jgi:molybdopterin-containing oxidoreductase family iron-sulfur binding subunit